MAYEVLVPPLGQTVDTVTLVAWYKEEGEIVREGEPLFVIETDKATLDVEAQASGILQRVTAAEGDEVTALSVIALIAAPGEQAANALAQSPRVAATTPREVSNRLPPNGSVANHSRIFISPRARQLAEREQVSLAALTPTGPEGAIVERDVRAYLAQTARTRATPVAERMAQDAGLDLAQVAGSGPRGRVTRRDVAAALEEAPVVEASAQEAVLAEFPLRGVRSLIAERMVQSVTTAAQVTLTAEADATALVALRQELAAAGVVVSYNDLFLYIVGHTLREHPALNASLQAGVIRQWRDLHIGLAVDTERGLLVPVVRDVGVKRLAQIAKESADLIARVKANQLRPDELRGGTFTLTNLGGLGVDAFTPIINLPETAILGVGRIKARPAVVGDAIAIRQMVWLSLTFDHRLVDGAPAARALQRIVQLVEQPALLHT
jgi:pyruvate dehydrogenase E2 component (dihydrolipoamide acetyltransferase)